MIHAQRVGAMLLAAAVIGRLLMPAAHARDLPHGRAPRSAPTGCESFGTDFHKLEGSDSCIRISGSVEAEAILRMGSGAGASFFPGTAKH